MDLPEILKQLPVKLPEYGFLPETEEKLAEYLQFLQGRADLQGLIQRYYAGIFENASYTPAELEQLPEQDGREEGLLFAVVFLLRYELLDGVLAQRGIPSEAKAGALNVIKQQIEKNKSYYGSIGFQGMYRSRLIGYLRPCEYILGRLCFEMTKFQSAFEVWRNKHDGSTIPVALEGFSYMPNGKRSPKDYTGALTEPTIQQSGEEVSVYTFDAAGCLQPEPITLRLSDYEKVLCTGADVLSVHIPQGGGMTPELVDAAFSMAEDFFAKYYPEKKFKAYVCSSWLLNTDLQEILSPTSNIRQFQNRFRTVITGANGYSLYWHIFGIEQFLPPEQLQPKNAFQSAVLERVKAGQTLYNGYGYILK